MKLSFSFRTDNGRARFAQGMTLVEMLVAVAAGLIVVGAFVSVTLDVNSMVKATGNYADLDEYSRNTLDMLSRDVRNASSINAASTSTNLVLENSYTGRQITYSWDGSNVVTRTSGAGFAQMVLTNCNYLDFDYFTRVPQNNLQFIDITNAVSFSEAKLISVSWRCSRTILGVKMNTESVQTAQVCLRN
jgi:prepilin-type N-terminal cleavage/methylation domain-containing protein